MASSIPGRPSGVRVSDLAILPWHLGALLPTFALERMTIERLTRPRQNVRHEQPIGQSQSESKPEKLRTSKCSLDDEHKRRLSRRNAPSRSGQEPNSQTRLELANGVAQRGLRHAQLRCQR